MAGRRHSDRPPGPTGHWLFRNTEDYDADRVGFLRRCQQTYGDTFSFDAKTIVVNDPGTVHELLGRTNEDFISESVPLAERRDLERLAHDAQVWMAARRAGWRGLNRAVATAHAGRMLRILDATLAGTAGTEVEVGPVMETFFGQAVADFCLGSDGAGIPAIVAENADAIHPLAASSLLLPSWLPLPKVRRFLRARKRTLTALTELIERRRAAGPGPERPRDLLDVLLREPALTPLQVQRLLRGIMLAAYGVPAAAMTWTVRELAARPDLYRQVVAEAATWDGQPTPPPVSELPFTEALVKEVLRFRPPTWLIGRTVRRETELAGWRLRPGDEVMFSPYLIHRDPRWWPEPDRFDPGRWLDGKPAPRRHTYLPFGAGPRVCVGLQLGMIQIVTATSRLAQRFDLSAPAAAESRPRFEGLLVPAGLRARFRDRSSPRGRPALPMTHRGTPA